MMEPAAATGHETTDQLAIRKQKSDEDKNMSGDSWVDLGQLSKQGSGILNGNSGVEEDDPALGPSPEMIKRVTYDQQTIETLE